MAEKKQDEEKTVEIFPTLEEKCKLFPDEYKVITPDNALHPGHLLAQVKKQAGRIAELEYSNAAMAKNIQELKQEKGEVVVDEKRKSVLTKEEEEEFEAKRNAEINRIMEIHNAAQYKQAGVNAVRVEELQYSNDARLSTINELKQENKELKQKNKELEELVYKLRTRIDNL